MRDFRDFGVADLVDALHANKIRFSEFAICCYLVGLYNRGERRSSMEIINSAAMSVHEMTARVFRDRLVNLSDAGFMPAHLRAVIADDDGASSGGGE